MTNYTGWSCIHCGEEVDGPINDHVCEVVVEEDNDEVFYINSEHQQAQPRQHLQRTPEQLEQRAARHHWGSRPNGR